MNLELHVLSAWQGNLERIQQLLLISTHSVPTNRINPQLQWLLSNVWDRHANKRAWHASRMPSTNPNRISFGLTVTAFVLTKLAQQYIVVTYSKQFGLSLCL